ncbi:deaminase [Nonomuraea lactucae]|uniref:deaminase n=1 Tax=Nonomuraea lactucae TaxID=2249762 RepID=UPI000DE1DD44|nr:deaminase [Nonomuraea lactucae]
MNPSEASDTDHHWLVKAIELAKQCPSSSTAFSVGAIIVDQHGREIASGYSRDTDVHVHAEESALSRADPLSLCHATLYSSLEPCSTRKSRPTSCTDLILRAGIPRVVIAWREPSLFVADCQGVELLQAHGVEVTELSDLADMARSVGMPESS